MRNEVRVYSCVSEVKPILMSVDAANRIGTGMKLANDGLRCLECRYAVPGWQREANREEVNRIRLKSLNERLKGHRESEITAQETSTQAKV